MNILFLDIDGVLSIGGGPKVNGIFIPTDDRLDLLKSIVTNVVDLHLVLSSTWRRMTRTRIRIRRYLALKGLDISGWTTTDPKINGRSNEIQHYIDTHSNWAVKKWAILDDDPSVIINDVPLFNTTYKEGLTKDIANSIISYYNS